MHAGWTFHPVLRMIACFPFYGLFGKQAFVLFMEVLACLFPWLMKFAVHSLVTSG